MEITHARLKEVLRYDPETGTLTWIAARKGIKASDVAGSFTSKGYRVIKIDGREYRAHRLAWLYMTGSWPSDTIDHIDGNRANNAFPNLREATQSQNLANTAVYKNNQLGIKGVDRVGNRYRAQIKTGGVRRYLGIFKTAEEAHAAYATAATKAFGEFARAS